MADKQNDIYQKNSPSLQSPSIAQEPTNISTEPDKNKEEDLMSKDGSWLNRLFLFLTFVCFAGTFWMMFGYESFWDKIIFYKPNNYQLPLISDLKYAFYLLPIFIAVKLSFERGCQGLMYHFLSQKYKNPYDEDLYKTGQIYKKKLATNLFKVVYYTFMVIFGHFALRDLSFFPTELLGSGDMKNMFSAGVPQYLFFEKTELFNVYYMLGLAFVLTDLIWLLLVYECQSDFYIMLLHHSITISLVAFSYLTNYSQIGVIVFYLHDVTDIFVYITRIIINTDYRDAIKVPVCTVLLISYLFFRIYLFAKLILTVYWYMNHWNLFSNTLWLFKCILLTMHVYWVSQIIKRFIYYNIEDVGGKIKKKK